MTDRYAVIGNPIGHGKSPPIRTDVFALEGLAYELICGRGLTPCPRLAANAGMRRLADGVGMRVEQVAEAFAWWRNMRPETAPMIRQLTTPWSEEACR